MSQQKNKEVRTQTFCFTLNNYTLAEELDLLCTALPVTYILCGYEIGESGTPHIQGYCELNHIMRAATIKKLGCGFERMHIEPRRGTQQQAIDYCKKDGNWIDNGTPRTTKQGKRGDLDDVRIAAIEHGMREVSTWANLQQIRVAEKYLEYNEPARNWKPTVMWFHGTTGTGKTRVAHDLSVNPYVKSDTSKWWNGYDRHDHVIIDDFRDNNMTFNELLTLLDRYERRVETKGGMRQFVPKQIIITCNTHPSNLYGKVTDERKDQLLRRIDIIQEFGNHDLARKSGGNTIAPDCHNDEI